ERVTSTRGCACKPTNLIVADALLQRPASTRPQPLDSASATGEAHPSPLPSCSHTRARSREAPRRTAHLSRDTPRSTQGRRHGRAHAPAIPRTDPHTLAGSLLSASPGP